MYKIKVLHIFSRSSECLSKTSVWNNIKEKCEPALVEEFLKYSDIFYKLSNPKYKVEY